MNKSKRLFLFFRGKSLKLERFLSNKHYKIVSFRYFSALGIDFAGKPKYINYDVDFDLIAPEKIHIGKNVVIAKGTIVLVHDYSIECGLETIGKQNESYESQFLKDVYIGDNCFVGARCILLPGLKIGNNCIVGAGSVLTGSFPNDSIIAGNPAKIIANTKTWALKKSKEKDIFRGTKN